MNSLNRRFWMLGAIAVAALILITLFGAPTSSKYHSGSTYGRDPDGYGAWYAFMEERGTPVQRWQKPFEALGKSEETKTPITLLRVYGSLTRKEIFNLQKDLLFEVEKTWIEKGNNLVMVGVWMPVTKAPFSTVQESPVAEVKINTRRRSHNQKQKLLGDRFGAVVWQEKIGQGKVIFAIPPDLAANAYQDEPGNYEFLAEIVTDSDREIWVDEYIHGYRDSEIIERDRKQSLHNYFSQTPLFPAFIQLLILLLVLIWAKNRRFGQPQTLSAPVVNNSQAYIEALAAVLQKAGTRDFILDVVGKEEQLQVQKALGLGEVPLDPEILAEVWTQQTGRPSTELLEQLQAISKNRRIRQSNLLIWVRKWKSIRGHLPS